MWDAAPENGDAALLDTLWGALDEAIDLKAADVYSYKADNDTDPFGGGPAAGGGSRGRGSAPGPACLAGHQ